MRAHEEEVRANRSALDKAIYEAVKNIIVWKDASAAIADCRATNAAREKIAAAVRKSFAAKASKSKLDKPIGNG